VSFPLLLMICSQTCMRSIERPTQFKKDYKNASKSIHSSELDSRLSEVIGYFALD
jgi:mRNA-degrading endonuclease YafQ of YafQ-DinJ toxin-antitoxin module